jgi:hypothetical protein
MPTGGASTVSSSGVCGSCPSTRSAAGCPSAAGCATGSASRERRATSGGYDPWWPLPGPARLGPGLTAWTTSAAARAAPGAQGRAGAEQPAAGLPRREADIAVRMLRPRQDQLLAAASDRSSSACMSARTICPGMALRAMRASWRAVRLSATTRAFSLQLDTWVTMHEGLRDSPRCRAAFDALVEGLQQYVA